MLDYNRCRGQFANGVRWKTEDARMALVEGDHLVPTRYDYPHKVPCLTLLGKITKVSRPEGRELHIGYHEATGKVRELQAPIGANNAIHPFATFNYPKEGICEVTGPSQERTRYLYSTKDHRITQKQEWSQNALYSQMQYFWGNAGKENGNLLSKALCDSSGAAHSSFHYTYDERGNVVRELVCGNLSGLSSPTHSINALGQTQIAEGYAIERTYHPVYSTILEERESDGFYTEYRYIHGSNLLRQKLVGGDVRVSREFFEYDNCANLVRHVMDNGTGHVDYLENVSMRLITEIQPIVTPLHPAFGKPAKKCEKYWEESGEHYLRTTDYHYNENGYPIQEDIYDSQNILRYSIQRIVDAAGRVLEETNPLGQKTRHRYDKNGNKVHTAWVDQEIEITYVYDAANRLICEEEHSDKTYKTLHRYDLSSRRVATVDPFGNETLYAYNDLGRVIAITHPVVNGQRGVERFEYDIAGNKIAVHDLLGGVTRTSYTARGQPICITYPDGSQEHYQYNGNGSVAKHTAQNGVTTEFCYDRYRRLIHKKIFGADGNYLYDTQASYHGNLLMSETDASGVQTHYKYDGAGRLIETLKGNQRTQYQYDSLGRQDKIIAWADEETAHITIKTFDLLDRLVEERAEDGKGNLYRCVHYTYDQKGNQSSQIVETHQGLAITEMQYDQRHRPIQVKDALGNITLTDHVEDFTTGFRTTTITDALGNQVITIKNSIGQTIEHLRRDFQGQLCAHSKYTYDIAGRKVLQEDNAIARGLPEHQVVTGWTYDSMGRLTLMTEALGSPEQRCTKYRYNDRGQKKTLQLPDGTKLKYTYDRLGRLERYYSSDNTIDYVYEYDLNGNVLTVTDALNKTVTERQYDANNRMVSETLANGLRLSYRYDGLGRIAHIDLPDSTGIAYSYDACHLTTVSRLSERPYQHHYTCYDLTGSLLEEQSPIGVLSYTQDLLNRPRQINSSHFCETIPEHGYDAVGNLLSKIRQTSEHQTLCDYSYDTLYQLKTETVTGFDTQEYTYDSLYNRRVCNGREHHINPLNQLLHTGETTYRYDKRGNLIAESSPADDAEYAYDALGRLSALTRRGVGYTYQYDAFNRRVAKSSEHDQERYLYIDQNEIGKVDASGEIVELRVLGHGKGAEIGSAIALELGDNIYIPVHDHCGHISLLLDLETKIPVEEYVYNAFGEEKRYGVATTNPWHFSSKRLDPESGWIYFGRRYYDPPTGRWTTPDPIGFTDGPNLYAYVKNSPLTHFDLYGLFGMSFGHERFTQHAYNQTVPGVISNGSAKLGDRRFLRVDLPSEYMDPFIKNINDRSDIYGFKVKQKDDVRPCMMTLTGVDQGFSVMYNHGINLNKKDVQTHMMAISDALGECPVYAVCRGTRGKAIDGAGIGCLKARKYNQEVNQGGDLLQGLLQREKTRNGKVLVLAYSGGADVTRRQLKQLSRLDTQRLQVLAVGPSCIIKSSECRDIDNLISSQDMVTQIAAPFAYSKAQDNPRDMRTTFLESQLPPGTFDHDFLGATYWPVIEERLSDFFKRYSR